MGKLYLLPFTSKGRKGKRRRGEGREFDLCPRKKKKEKSAHLLAREKCASTSRLKATAPKLHLLGVAFSRVYKPATIQTAVTSMWLITMSRTHTHRASRSINECALRRAGRHDFMNGGVSLINYARMHTSPPSSTIDTNSLLVIPGKNTGNIPPVRSDICPHKRPQHHPNC